MRYSIEVNGEKVDELLDRDGDEVFDPTEADSCKLKNGKFVRFTPGDRITVVVDSV